MHRVVLEHTTLAVEWVEGKDSIRRRWPGKLDRRLDDLMKLYLKSRRNAT
jgi:hypothetical protein